MTPSGSGPSISPNFNNTGLIANSSSVGSQKGNAGDKNAILQELDKLSADVFKMKQELHVMKLKDRISKASPEERAAIKNRLQQIKDKRTAEKVAKAAADTEHKI